MASIVKRNGKFCVVYLYDDLTNEKKQKWETYKTHAEALARKKEIEYKENIGTFVVPSCKTVNDLLEEYVRLYGKEKWALSTYQNNKAFINNYISPYLGNMRLSELNTHVIEKYYQKLLKTKCVDLSRGKKRHEYCTPNMVKTAHKLLTSCFTQAMRWELLEKNPCLYATVPRTQYNERDIWDSETLMHALELCEDERLRLCMNLSFACSLRLGELLGLTWDCVYISDDDIESGTASVYVNKELQRVNRQALNELDNKDVQFVFPSANSLTKTVLVLKTPKTKTSIRKVFLPKTVAEMLVEWKKKQDAVIEMLGSEYQDYNLVIAGALGYPTEASTIKEAFCKLIKDNDLPEVVFHSLRHTSITYKLKLNGGDIKSVQGDSGHAQVKMVTDVYSHIIDEDRRMNAELFENAFYSGKKQEESQKVNLLPTENEKVSNEALLEEVLANPEILAALKVLAKTL